MLAADVIVDQRLLGVLDRALNRFVSTGFKAGRDVGG
jgi:hypothetical protein